MPMPDSASSARKRTSCIAVTTRLPVSARCSIFMRGSPLRRRLANEAAFSAVISQTIPPVPSSVRPLWRPPRAGRLADFSSDESRSDIACRRSVMLPCLFLSSDALRLDDPPDSFVPPMLSIEAVFERPGGPMLRFFEVVAFERAGFIREVATFAIVACAFSAGFSFSWLLSTV
eukprot:13405-Prymnesium_polylepis.3